MPQIRPFSSRDTLPVVDLLSKVLPAEKIDEAKFVRHVLLDPNVLPSGFLVAEEAGKAVGVILAIARQFPVGKVVPDKQTGYLTLLAVAPEARGQGIGTKLLEEAEVFLITQGRRELIASAYSPGYFTPGVDVAAYEEGLRFLKKRGFEEKYRPLSMEVDLGALIKPSWVTESRAEAEAAGVTLEPWRAELTLPLLRFSEAEFSADWSRYATEAVQGILRGDPAERLWIAWTSDTPKPSPKKGGLEAWLEEAEAVGTGDPAVIGFSHYDGERFGPIGIAKSERGRGLGHVLMFETLAAQKAAGHARSYFMWSDDRTAERLYNAAGFREARRFAVLRKEL